MGLIPDWLHPYKNSNTEEEETEEEVEVEPVEDDEEEEERFECEYCDFSTDSQTGVNIHTGRVHGQTSEEDEEEE